MNDPVILFGNNFNSIIKLNTDMLIIKKYYGYFIVSGFMMFSASLAYFNKIDPVKDNGTETKLHNSDDDKKYQEPKPNPYIRLNPLKNI